MLETKILLKYYITYKLYAEIIKDFEKIFIFHTWRKNWMYIEFSYKNKELNSDKNTDVIVNNTDENIDVIVNNLNNILKRLNIFEIYLLINSGNSKYKNLIQKIVELYYFNGIYLGKKYFSIYNFTKLKNVKKVFIKNLHMENLLYLPENLEKLEICDDNLKNKNVIINIPNKVKKIYYFNNEFIDLEEINAKKILFIGSLVSNKNNLFVNLFDYDVLIINNFIPSNIKYIDFNNLPYTLKILHIYCKINQEILSLPNSIQELKINYYYKNLLENLPCTLKKIQLDFVINIENINLLLFLPNSLEEIIFYSVSLPDHVKIFDIKLPVRIKKIIIKLQSTNFYFILLNKLYSTKRNFNIVSNYLFSRKIEFI